MPVIKNASPTFELTTSTANHTFIAPVAETLNLDTQCQQMHGAKCVLWYKYLILKLLSFLLMHALTVFYHIFCHTVVIIIQIVCFGDMKSLP